MCTGTSATSKLLNKAHLFKILLWILQCCSPVKFDNILKNFLQSRVFSLKRIFCSWMAVLPTTALDNLLHCVDMYRCIPSSKIFYIRRAQLKSNFFIPFLLAPSLHFTTWYYHLLRREAPSKKVDTLDSWHREENNLDHWWDEEFLSPSHYSCEFIITTH